MGSSVSRRETAAEEWLLLFFLFSAAGWVWETLFSVLTTGQWVNRGMLHGPWLPVYGFGGAVIAAVLERLDRRWAAPLAGAVLGGGVEYGTALLLEWRFQRRWWDYAGWPGSLSGRVCLASAAAFGLAGWLLTGWAEPLLRRGLEKLPPLWRRACCRGLCLLFAADAALSLLRPNSGAGISFPV